MDTTHTIVKSLQPIAIAIGFVAVYIAEHLLPERKDLMDRKHDLFNIGIGSVNIIIAALGGFFLQQWLLYTSLFHSGVVQHIHFRWLRFFLGFVALDIFMYWWHRANHEVVFLWRFHRFHHTDVKLNATSAIRFHAVEILLSYVLRFALFPIIGIGITTVLVYSIIFFIVVVVHHSNIRIAEGADLILRKLVVTPGMHRIHHSVIRRETNSNYGSVFPWWDAIFRSYTAAPAGPIKFGVD